MSRLRANQITNENANGAPNFPHGLTVTGIITATNNQTTFNNIVVGSAVTANSQGVDVTGIVTATSFKGNGSALTGITQTTINNNANNRVITGSGTANTLEAESSFTFDAGQSVITGTQAQLRVSGSVQGRILYTDSGATTNKQSFDITSEGDSLRFRSLSDDINSVRANAMTIAGDTGYVNFPTRPMAVVGRAGGNVGAGVIIFDAVHINHQSVYNSSNGRFTAPITGYYFCGFFAISNGNSTFDTELLLNGNTEHRMAPYASSGSANHHHIGATTIIYMTAGQYVQMKVNSGTMYGASSGGRHGGFNFWLLA
tara:strand:- start:169 stop:1110 length:942 start_codon:yes stop_codon:yes gene_type:complete